MSVQCNYPKCGCTDEVCDDASREEASKRNPVYPEHDKLSARGDEHATLQSFIEWLMGHDKFSVCEFVKGHACGYEWEPDAHVPIQEYKVAKIVAEYFDIDVKAFEREKELMLESLWS